MATTCGKHYSRQDTIDRGAADAREGKTFADALVRSVGGEV